jgi:hypothetical protein
MTRTSVAALSLLLAASTAHAQNAPQTFDRLPMNGQEVYVVPEAGAEVEGRLIAFDQDSIALWANGARRTFLREDVRRIYRRGDSLMNGARVGMMVGLVTSIGLSVAASIDACDDFTNEITIGCIGLVNIAMMSVMAPAGIGLGLVVGATIDSLHRGRTLIYQRPAGLAIGLAPIVTRERQGLSVSVGW